MIVESIHILFDEIKEVSKTSVANNTLGLVPQRQYVSSSADAHVPSQQELDLLFGPLYDEFFNADIKNHSAGGSCKTADMMEFKKCIEEMKVEDLSCSGLPYIWIQSRLNPGNGILKKIDRVLGDNCFMGNFLAARAMFLPHLSLDHCLAVLYVPKMVKKRKKDFKFANFTIDKPEFLDVLSWKNGNIYERVTKWKGKLQNIQTRVDISPHDADLKREKARIIKVAAIRNEEGVLFEDEKVPDIFVQHFQKFLRTSLKVKEMSDDMVPMKCVSPDDANEMIKDVTNKEIKDAIFDIEENKASGPDGFSSKFFKKA
nr:hypothetical protein [Tanacetum cinerariifolium]